MNTIIIKLTLKPLKIIVQFNINDAKTTITITQNDMKKIWATINDTLNTNKTKMKTEFIIDNESIIDSNEIADHFNNFFVNIGSNLSSNIELNNGSLKNTHSRKD